MMATSTTNTIAGVQRATARRRRQVGSHTSIAAIVRENTPVDTANFAGFSHAGAPMIVRASSTMARTSTGVSDSNSNPTAVSGGLADHIARRYVVTVNILYAQVLTMSTCTVEWGNGEFIA